MHKYIKEDKKDLQFKKVKYFKIIDLKYSNTSSRSVSTAHVSTTKQYKNNEDATDFTMIILHESSSPNDKVRSLLYASVKGSNLHRHHIVTARSFIVAQICVYVCV